MNQRWLKMARTIRGRAHMKADVTVKRERTAPRSMAPFSRLRPLCVCNCTTEQRESALCLPFPSGSESPTSCRCQISRFQPPISTGRPARARAQACGRELASTLSDRAWPGWQCGYASLRSPSMKPRAQRKRWQGIPGGGGCLPMGRKASRSWEGILPTISSVGAVR